MGGEFGGEFLALLDGSLVPQAFGLQKNHLPPAHVVAGFPRQFGGLPGFGVGGDVVPPFPAFARSQLRDHEG